MQANYPAAPWNQDKTKDNFKKVTERNVEFESKKTKVKNNHAGGVEHPTLAGGSTEINLLELINRSKASGVETPNPYKELENEQDKVCEQEDEDEEGIKWHIWKL